MSIKDLTEKVKKGLKREGPEDRKERLIRAKILDKNGNFHSDFFRPTAKT